MELGRRVLGIVVALLLVAGVAAAALAPGRGGDQVISLAATRMAEVETFRTEMRVETESASGDAAPQFGFVARGSYDVPAGRSRMVTTIGLDQDAQLETLTIGGMEYVRAPESLHGGSVPTRWAAYPATGGPEGLVDSPLSVGSAFDQLQAMAGVEATPELVGDDEVRGVATRRYRHVFSEDEAQRYFKRAGGSSGELLRAGLHRLEFDLWVDGDDLVRRQQLQITFTSDATDAVAVSSTVEFFDFGVEIEPIEAPPDDDVTYFDSVESYRAETRPAGVP